MKNRKLLSTLLVSLSILTLAAPAVSAKEVPVKTVAQLPQSPQLEAVAQQASYKLLLIPVSRVSGLTPTEIKPDTLINIDTLAQKEEVQIAKVLGTYTPTDTPSTYLILDVPPITEALILQSLYAMDTLNLTELSDDMKSQQSVFGTTNKDAKIQLAEGPLTPLTNILFNAHNQ